MKIKYLNFYIIVLLLSNVLSLKAFSFEFEKILSDRLKLVEDSTLNSDNLRLNSDDFLITHSHDFSNNTIGQYNLDEWRRDWLVNKHNDNRYLFIDQQNNNRNLRHHFPNGSWGAGGNGANWTSPVGQGGHEELYLTYRIFFENGFDWGLGGKLPGFKAAGRGASGCSGPNLANDVGFSTRLMWNQDASLRLYLYHHGMTTTCGDPMGLPNWARLQSGRWHTITMRVVMNTVNVSNGIIEVWLDGKLVASSNRVRWRVSGSPQDIRELFMATFMGGNTRDWAPNRNQSLWMDDIVMWKYNQSYLSQNSNIARGLQLHDPNRTIYTPLDDRPQQEIRVSKITTEITPSNSGTIVYEKGNDNSSNGTVVALRARPNPGFRFMGWEVSGLNQQIGNTELIEFTKPDNDMTLRAVFEPTNTSSNSFLDGLRVYYEMDQNQNNVLIDSHNGHNGNNRGNVQLVNGFRDNGFQYNGRTSISEVPHADLLNLYTQFTIAVDIYRTGNGQSGTSILVGKEFPENRFSQIYSIGITPENRLRIRTMSNGNERNFETRAAIPARTWQRVIVTYQAGKGYEVYINKTEKESSPALNGSIQNSSGPLFIGANSDLDGGAANQDRRFEGILDNVAIWDRALTFEQIKELIEKRLTYPDFGDNNGEPKSLRTKVYPEGSGTVKVTLSN